MSTHVYFLRHRAARGLWPWLLAALLIGAGVAAQPVGLHYQARLTDPGTGAPRSGVFTVTFRIYDVPEGGAALWTETKDVAAADGLLNTLLGDGAVLPGELFDGRPLWLGVKVGADAEAVPRQYLAPVAYAVHAARAARAADADTVGGLGADDVARAAHEHEAGAVSSGELDDARIPAAIARDAEVMDLVRSQDGTGSNLDADLVDGMDSSAFSPAGHHHSGMYVVTEGPSNITGNEGGPLLTVEQGGAGPAGRFISTGAHGVMGETSGLGGASGVRGNAGSSGYMPGGKYGVYGDSDAGVGTAGISGTSNGVLAYSAGSTGLWAEGSTGGVYAASSAPNSDAVYALNSATTGSSWGVRGQSASIAGRGVHGSATAATGTTYGVFGTSSSTAGTGVYGIVNALTGDTSGVHGVSGSSTGRGVTGEVTHRSGANYGVYGISPSTGGTAVYGHATAATGATYGVHGESESTGASAGVRGDGAYVGVWGDSTGSWGVYGRSTHASGYGVYGAATGADGYAGYFAGRVNVTGTLTKGGGAFKIDHPLDPENKYLQHSFVESPDMMNVYNGNVTLDASGGARVALPAYFQALNRDFRYQLCAIGGAAPNLHVSQEIENNAFHIAGGTPGLKVSWQVTGTRHDAFAEANRIAVEVEKPKEEKGTYLHAEALGKGAAKSLSRLTEPDVAR